MSVTEKLAELRTKWTHERIFGDDAIELIAAVEALRAELAKKIDINIAYRLGARKPPPLRPSKGALEEADKIITAAAPMLATPAQSPADGERSAIIPQ